MGEGEAGIMLSVQKNEKITNSTHFKIKFYIIFIKNYFSMMNIKILTYGREGPGGIIRSEK